MILFLRLKKLVLISTDTSPWSIALLFKLFWLQVDYIDSSF